MIFRQLEAKLNTQNGTYWAFGWIGKERVRKPLGTDRAGAADHRVDWIKRACEEGPSSGYWPQLEEALPPRSFEYFSGLVGYVEQAPSAKSEPTWAMLKTAYTQQLDRPIESGKRKGRLRSASTKSRYLEVLRIFDRFLTEKDISQLSEITEQVAQEDFQQWRVADIAKKPNHRAVSDATRLPGGYVLDVAILCGVFKFAVAKEYVIKSPFRYVGKPGADAENGAAPFLKSELDALVRNAGADLLSVLVLLRTGLRRSDVIRLQWKHVGVSHIGITAQKNGNKVRVPIVPDLAAAFEHICNTRFGESRDVEDHANEFVLLNPFTGKPFDTGKKLYERIQKVGERANVKNAHPHRFRDSFAKDCFMRGFTVEEVAAYLGDASETVAAHYGEMDTDRLEHADKKMLRDGGLLNAVDVSQVHTAGVRHAKVVPMDRRKANAA